MSEDRAIQTCDICGQQDVHPRHTIHALGGEFRSAHFDCCSAAGCTPCAKALAEAPKNQRHGEHLIAYLTEG